MTEHEANPQAEALRPQGPSAKQIAKEVLAGIRPIPHGEAISSIEYLSQIRSTVITITEGVPFASAAWTTADTAVYVPFVVRDTFAVRQLRLTNGTTVSGSFDIGVYDSTDEGLPRTRLVAAGT